MQRPGEKRGEKKERGAAETEQGDWGSGRKGTGGGGEYQKDRPLMGLIEQKKHRRVCPGFVMYLWKGEESEQSTWTPCMMKRLDQGEENCPGLCSIKGRRAQ